MDEYMTTVRMRPVCSCGYIFWDGIVIRRNMNETYGFKYVAQDIEPPVCPNCKKIIECIEYPAINEE